MTQWGKEVLSMLLWAWSGTVYSLLEAANVRQAARAYLRYWKERGYIKGSSFAKTGDGFSYLTLPMPKGRRKVKYK